MDEESKIEVNDKKRKGNVYFNNYPIKNKNDNWVMV